MDLQKFNPSPNMLVGLVLGGVAILFVAMFVRRRTDGPNDRISTPARVCLVLLRMAIGWHFLIEGLDKLHTPNWSSEIYLREAVGPLAPTFRDLAGDNVVAQLTLDAEGKNLPPALEAEWQRYFDAFTTHYGFTDAQRQAAQAKYDQAKAATLAWMHRKQTVKKLSPFPPEYDVDWTVEDRLKEYKNRFQARVTETESALPSRGKEAWKDWRDAKADLTRWRGDLKKDLDAQTATFKTSLNEMMKPPVDKKKTPEKQKAAEEAEKGQEDALVDSAKAFYESLSAAQKAKAPLAEPLPRPINWRNHLDVADNAVKYGLVAVGFGLIAGCFTRLSALFGAVLLLMFFLAMPPLPYLPESPKAEGHYLYINKNIIEMLALLALASLPTGRWAGLDGLLQFLNPLNWPAKPRPAAAPLDKRLPATAKK